MHYGGRLYSSAVRTDRLYQISNGAQFLASRVESKIVARRDECEYELRNARELWHDEATVV